MRIDSGPGAWCSKSVTQTVTQTVTALCQELANALGATTCWCCLAPLNLDSLLMAHRLWMQRVKGCVCRAARLNADACVLCTGHSPHLLLHPWHTPERYLMNDARYTAEQACTRVLAGRCALWRAAAGYSPCAEEYQSHAHCRCHSDDAARLLVCFSAGEAGCGMCRGPCATETDKWVLRGWFCTKGHRKAPIPKPGSIVEAIQRV